MHMCWVCGHALHIIIHIHSLHVCSVFCYMYMYICMYTCQGVVENVIMFQQATPIVEYTDTSFFAVVDFVPTQNRVAVCLDPHACQCISINVILL